MKDRLIVALDLSDSNRLDPVLRDLQGNVGWVKVGMELFYRFGPEVVHKVKDYGFRIFLDLKLHDIPNTVERASKNLAALGVDMFNVHTSGGCVMMAGAASAAKSVAETLGQSPAMVIGVTVLTSISPEVWQDEIQGGLKLPEHVAHFSSLAKESGLAGVVCSPQEITRVKELNGKEFVTVVPGIRPAWAATGDQKRITTPRDAIALGADYLVVGRPILDAADIQGAAKRILEEMEEGAAG